MITLIRGGASFVLGYMLCCTGYWLYASWQYGQLIDATPKQILKGGSVALWHLVDKLPL